MSKQLKNQKIKRPMNAYMLFSKEKSADIIQQKFELKSKVAEVAKLIGNHWKEMTNEQKDKYVKMAKFIQEQINYYNWYKESYIIEIFNCI